MLLLPHGIRPDQRVHGNVEIPRDLRQELHVRVTRSSLPAADGLRGDAELLGERFLRQVLCQSEFSHIFAKVQLHILILRSENQARILCL